MSAAAIEIPDSTDATIGLLRELRRGHVRKQAANVAYWLYLAGLVILIYGGWLVATIARALRHPQPPVADTAALLRAAPAGLPALALLVLAAMLWDARWRGPVTVSQQTVDWLLDTPVRRERLLRPRYRASALIRLLIAAVAGLVPAGLLLSVGLGGAAGHSLRLAGTAMLSAALLVGFGTGAAAVSEAHPRFGSSRAAPAIVGLAALAAAVLAVLAAVSSLPAWVGSAVLWSGPWGWAAQGLVALAGGRAPEWPVAVLLLALAAAVVIGAGDRAAAVVPAAALRVRAATIGSMSAAVANLDVRRVGTAYRAATTGYGRVRFGLRLPLRRELVLPWRDVVAVLRAPSRLAWAVLLSWTAVGLGAVAVHAPHSALLPLAGALSFGYLAASNLCEGARLDADDTRRSAQLPFRYDSLVWWHAIVPCTTLAVIGGIPAAALAVVTGKPALLGIVAVAIVVLVGGALVNAYRGPLEAESLAQGFETPFGNSGGIMVTFWYVTGPLLAVGPLILLANVAISAKHTTAIATPAILAVALAAWLGSIAARRARRLRTG
ncbi:MAG TPA: DUF6297 family protein [Streptosporangiaceae bacterium]|jgi:hypothetical protein